MSGPHRIRLQAAWQSAAAGAVWTRSFGRPTGIDPGDRIWLVIEAPKACAAKLNGRPLPVVVGVMAAWRHDVTAELLERNDLRLEFDAPSDVESVTARSPLPDALGLVALEIDPGE